MFCEPFRNYISSHLDLCVLTFAIVVVVATILLLSHSVCLNKKLFIYPFALLCEYVHFKRMHRHTEPAQAHTHTGRGRERDEETPRLTQSRSGRKRNETCVIQHTTTTSVANYICMYRATLQTIHIDINFCVLCSIAAISLLSRLLSP